MKTSNLPIALLLAATPFLGSCSNPSKQPAAAAAPLAVKSKASTKSTSGKASREVAKADETDEYAEPEVSDPLQGLNRATFRFNDGLYTVLIRPISKGYEAVIPKAMRKGIDNAFDNVKFPVRLVNCVLQVKFERAGKETQKFVVNSVVGVGGLVRVSDKIASLTDVPPADTGLTFAHWGMGHGPYLVLPLLGPSSLRDGVGYAGDYALNPVNWGMFWRGRHDWTMIPPAVNTVRASPEQLSKYDAATKDAVDPYLSARSAYLQNRAEAAKQ